MPKQRGFAPIFLLPVVLVGLVFVYWVYSYTGSILHNPSFSTSPSPKVCAQVISYAKNPHTGLCEEFPTPCDVPKGWSKEDNCRPVIINQADISNWKTYTNTKYGYSFKYPSDYILQQNINGKNSNISDNADVIWLSLIANQDPLRGNYSETVQISAMNNPNDLSIQEFMNQLQLKRGIDHLDKLIQYKPITINEIQGLLSRDFYKISTSEICGSNNDQDILLKNRNKIYWISYNMYQKCNPQPNKKITEKTFNQILSTFKFLP